MSPVRSTARLALGGTLMFAGTSHLSFGREAFRAQVPKTVGKVGPLSTDQVVLASGVVEIALGATIAFAPERHRELVGNIAATFFTAVFPATSLSSSTTATPSGSTPTASVSSGCWVSRSSSRGRSGRRAPRADSSATPLEPDTGSNLSTCSLNLWKDAK